MKVSIPKPCTENWGEMSPTQRGAFCKTCAIDVIDFSDKKPAEVKETLLANIGKQMCGRFSKTQLSNLSRDYQIWKNQSVKTFQSKFLWACLMAFGLTLFTGCENSNAQNILMHSLNENQNSLPLADSLKTDSDTTYSGDIDTLNQPPNPIDFIFGDIEYIEQEPDIMLMGEPAIEMPEIIESTCGTTPQDSTKTTKDLEPNVKNYVMGKMAPPPNFEEYLVDTAAVQNLPVKINTETIQASVYPNPRRTISTLKVSTTDPARHVIALFNMDGRFMKTIYTGRIGTEEQNFTIDLSNYSTGTYLVKITAKNVAYALKVNKVN